MKMTDQFKEMAEEGRKNKKERLSLIKNGELSQALLSLSSVDSVYMEMRDVFNSLREQSALMTKKMNKILTEHKFDAEESKASLRLIEKFNENAKKLMLDSMPSLDGIVVNKNEIEDIVDDSKYASLLDRIANADKLTAIRLTAIAYKIAMSTIGSIKSKLLKLESRIEKSGSTENERDSARNLEQRQQLALDIVTKRKDVIVEMNLKLRREVTMFCTENAVNADSDRDITDEEKKILKGLH